MTFEDSHETFQFTGTHSQRSSPAFHPRVRKANDVTAGAVLLTAIATAVIGAIVFWPYLQK